MKTAMQELRAQLSNVGRRLLNECDRDMVSPTRGCCDRRYWGWKLTDFPEITYQRNAMLLSWLATHEQNSRHSSQLLMVARDAALFAIRCQHKDGSFDQAYPNERSFAATAFLLLPLLSARLLIKNLMTSDEQRRYDIGLQRAADFIIRHDEHHGRISNHLAGAAAALTAAAAYFGEVRYGHASSTLIDRIVASQSPEGWFPEYAGADPGYQTLCIYYLARAYRLHPAEHLRQALAKAIEFVSWCVHPDGTFAGEYGSRRTAVFYPGGFALLATEIPQAASVLRAMLPAVAARKTIAVDDIDIGNIAPLAENYIAVLEQESLPTGTESLPMEKEKVERWYPAAGLFFCGRKRYYAVFGTGNGAVLKVFDKHRHCVCWNDGGYLGNMQDGGMITTQVTMPNAGVELAGGRISVIVPFARISLPMPTPAKMTLLRLANLTVMRWSFINELIKKMLVRLLITGQRTVPVKLRRTIQWAEDVVSVHDEIVADKPVAIAELKCGMPYVSIHMASARYYEQGGDSVPPTPIVIDAKEFIASNRVMREYRVFPPPETTPA